MAVISVAPTAGNLLAIASLSTIGYLISQVIYNLFFHPLRHFPGPLLLRATRISYSYSLLSGRLPFDILEWHKVYGEVVRVAPDELAFANSRAWKDIMGHRSIGWPEMEKAKTFYRAPNQPTSIINAPREEHIQARRQLAHGFSDKSLREQQPIIKKYVDLLIQRLYEKSDGGKEAIDVVKWYNYTTFDVIGDLAFGEPFGCLETSQYHPWALVFLSVKLRAYLQAANFFPLIKKVVIAMTSKSFMQNRGDHNRLTREKLLRRMALGAERPDLIEGLLRKKDELNMSIEQLQLNSSLLIVAGSETTATLLSGVTYFLTTNPDALKRLTKEVRSAFKSEDDINFTSVSNLQYMLACLDEALRMYPPAPSGLPREVPKGGATIAGYFVPEDTTVSMFHYALYRDPRSFTAPDDYHPERWLEDPRFATDNRDIFNPFNVGPRNCIGKNLAYFQMRIILARVLWNFDLKLADDSKDWLSRQKIFLLWDKGPLNIYLTPRER